MRGLVSSAVALVFLGVLPAQAQMFGGGPTLVRVAPASLEDIADTVDALGTTRANETTDITATVTEKVVEINFTDGAQVEKDQILVRLDAAEEQANLKSARATLETARQELKRTIALEKKGAASQSALDEARTALVAAEADIATLESRLADRIIRAPFAGTVGFRQVSPGALGRPGDVITTLTDTSSLKLDFTVPALDLDALREGLVIEARAAAFGAERFEGTVQSISPTIDPITRAVTVRALLPNPEGRLRPGLLMSVELQKNPRRALMVPEGALVQTGRHVYVYTIEAGKAERKEIKIGTRKPGLVEVREGLSDGVEVITHGTHKIRPGQPVEVTKSESRAPSLAEGEALAGG